MCLPLQTLPHILAFPAILACHPLSLTLLNLVYKMTVIYCTDHSWSRWCVDLLVLFLSKTAVDARRLVVLLSFPLPPLELVQSLVAHWLYHHQQYLPSCYLVACQCTLWLYWLNCESYYHNSLSL